MKKVLIIVMALFSLQSVYAQSKEYQNQSVKKNEKKWTMDQVKSIASKYNLQNHKLLTESKNSGLMYSTKEEIEGWCQRVTEFNKEIETYNAYKLLKSQNVRTLEDYFKYIDSFPPMREAYLQAFSSKEEMNKWRDKLRTCKTWRIYRNDKGRLALREGDTPVTKEESLLGKRIDSLPKF